MILPSEDKSSIANQQSSLFVAGQYAPGGSADRIPASNHSQTYIPSSPLHGDYDPELYPPAYERIPDIGNSTQRTGIPNAPHTIYPLADARTPNVDVTPVRETFIVNPSGQADAHPGTQTMHEPLAGPSVYATPPNVTEMIGAATSSAPSDYTIPPVRTNVYPRYSSPNSFSGPPLPTPSRGLLPSVGSASSPSKNQSPPMPPSFSRPPAPNLICTTFPPIYLIANGRYLDEGFPAVPPPSPMQPHPFSSRDVREVDWIRFLRDLKKTAKLSGREKVAVAVGVLIPGIFPDVCVEDIIRNTMKSKKSKPVGKLIDNWNYYFFHPRQLEIVLAKGLDRVDSGDGAVPLLDPQIERMALRLTTSAQTPSRSSSSSSSSSNRSNSRSPHRHRERRREGYAEDTERDERRRGKQTERGRGVDKKQYRLFVVGF
ncbi:hypothetical protein PILCRDRAFT_827134 [Piloderma croceum F 1598]|uniref:Uncharacterized protein n=1 Tax=Piloderma croceum (strain F 1598) TaxID=765440 RepID=A0A0C3F6K8_PILCF|nr:hypothetical protein PILCRDRAFT_827134 [Piloderma croceum F 1598]